MSQVLGVSRNQYRTVAVARKFGVAAYPWPSKMLVARQKLYLLATRRSFMLCRLFGFAPDKSFLTADGYEVGIQAMHLGHQLLTRLLLPHMCAPRISLLHCCFVSAPLAHLDAA